MDVDQVLDAGFGVWQVQVEEPAFRLVFMRGEGVRVPGSRT